MARHLLPGSLVDPVGAICPIGLRSQREEVRSMTSRKANEFARLLDAPRTTDDPAVAPYLALAGALRSMPAMRGPSPKFRAALRQRLVAVATVQPAGAAAETTSMRMREAAGTWRVQRRLAVVAGGAAAATAIAGVG